MCKNEAALNNYNRQMLISGTALTETAFIFNSVFIVKKENYAILLVQSVQLDLSYRMISASTNTSSLLIAFSPKNENTC